MESRSPALSAVEISADNVTELGVGGREQGVPDVTLPVDRPLAAIGAEHHRQFVGGFCNDGYGPIHRLTLVVVEVRQQLDYGPPADMGGGYGFDADVALGPQQLIVADKSSKLSMTAHLPLPGVVNRHLAGPYFLKFVGAPGLEGGEVLLNGISKADGPRLATGEFNGTNEIWKPWHFALHDPLSSGGTVNRLTRRVDPPSAPIPSARLFVPTSHRQLTLTSQRICQGNFAPDNSCDFVRSRKESYCSTSFAANPEDRGAAGGVGRS